MESSNQGMKDETNSR